MCLDVGGDAVETVDWERAGVMGGYHGRFSTIAVNLNLIGQFPVTHTHTHTHSLATIFAWVVTAQEIMSTLNMHVIPINELSTRLVN